jgi:glycosyltransferase involved in cell wall biosynthesis
MFAGNIGAAQDFTTILAAAELLKPFSDIHWVILGDGRMKAIAESQALDRGIQDTFHFLGRHPTESMPQFFSRADVMLVTLKKHPIFSLTIPTKVQSYLACGRPVVAAIDGEGARIIAEAEAGFTCPTETPAALAETILKMYKLSKVDREKMGMNGRRYYEANFDRTMLLTKLEGWMKDLVLNYPSKSSA